MSQNHFRATSEHPPSITDIQHEAQRLKLRWLFAIVMVSWTFMSIAAPIFVFCLTKSLFSFSLFSTLAPPIYLWYRFARYILMDERLFELEKLKIQMKMQNDIKNRW